MSAQQIEKVFDELDTTASGTLIMADIKLMLEAAGEPANKRAIKALLRDMTVAGGSKGSKSVSKRAFVSWYTSISLEHPVRNYIRTTHGLASAVRYDTDCLSDQEIITVFYELDVDNAGILTVAGADKLLQEMLKLNLHGRPPPVKDAAALMVSTTLALGRCSPLLLGNSGSAFHS